MEKNAASGIECCRSSIKKKKNATSTIIKSKKMIESLKDNTTKT
jgi:hypothetical protein